MSTPLLCATLFRHMLLMPAGQNVGSLTGWTKRFLNKTETVLIERPHKKSVRKIVGRALRNEINVT